MASFQGRFMSSRGDGDVTGGSPDSTLTGFSSDCSIIRHPAKVTARYSPPNSAPPRSRVSNFKHAQRNPSPFPFKSSPLAAVSPLRSISSGTPGTGRKKNWMNAASKRFGLSTSKQKRVDGVASLDTKPALTTGGFSSGPNARNPVVYYDPSSSGRPRATPRLDPTTTKVHFSPQDKPLPSLPVATIKQNTPVRRSLIDCSERPLRRSITPPDSEEPMEEDWPAISPEKGDGIRRDLDPSSSTKPSIGESVIEAMRALNITDQTCGKEQPNSATAKTQHLDKEADLVNRFSFKDLPNESFKLSAVSENQARHLISSPPENFYEGRLGRPLSSSQVPKPRDSMLDSLSRHLESPDIQVRHTKTSAMRLRQSAGNKTWSPNGGLNVVVNDNLLKGEKLGHATASDYATSTSSRTSKYTAGSGPIRTNSRKTHGVTGRGSPYTIPSRSNSKLGNVAQNADSERTLRADQPFGLGESNESNGNTAPRATQNAVKNFSKRSSLPLPSHKLHGRVTSKEDDHGKVAMGQSMRLIVNSPALSQVAEIDCASLHQGGPSHPCSPVQDSTPVRAPSPVPSLSQNHALLSICNPVMPVTGTQPTGQLLSVAEALSTEVPPPDEYVLDSDTTEGSVQGYDSFGGLRIKRVRTINKRGPTLKIRDSAERVIMGSMDVKPKAGKIPSASKSADETENGDSPGSCSMRNNLNHPFSGLFERAAPPVGSFTDEADTKFEDVRPSSDAGALLDNADLNFKPSEWSNQDQATSPSTSTFNHRAARNNRKECSETGEPARSGTFHENYGDWPGKVFAPPGLDHQSSTGSVAQVPSNSPSIKNADMQKIIPATAIRRTPGSTARPPTIILKEEPSRATAPFLFQNLEPQQGTENRGAIDKFHFSFSQPNSIDSNPNGASPPDNSSRKSKPPPIVVSPPDNNPAKSLPFKPMKAYGVDPGTLEKPRNVSTYSQSLKNNGFGPNSTNTNEGYDGSTKALSSKKAFSNIRGLFHKKSNETGAVTGLTEKLNSVRRQPTLNEVATKYANPLHTSGSTKATGLRKKDASIRKPFASPVTPFTATGSTTPLPASAITTQNTTTTPIATATNLTHTLLDLASSEPSKTRKAALLTLSKCMVSIVQSATDAEQASELAQAQAIKAEMAHLKVCRDIGMVEENIRAWLASMAKEKKREVEWETIVDEWDKNGFIPRQAAE